MHNGLISLFYIGMGLNFKLKTWPGLTQQTGLTEYNDIKLMYINPGPDATSLNSRLPSTQIMLKQVCGDRFIYILMIKIENSFPGFIVTR